VSPSHIGELFELLRLSLHGGPRDVAVATWWQVDTHHQSCTLDSCVTGQRVGAGFDSVGMSRNRGSWKAVFRDTRSMDQLSLSITALSMRLTAAAWLIGMTLTSFRGLMVRI
jgi:hypothetical protein